MDNKTRQLFAIIRQHIHEVCWLCWHGYDGTNAEGEPVLGVRDSAECICEPCVEITKLLQAVLSA